MNEEDGLLTLLNLSSALIMSVKDPKPGDWTLRVGSSGESTVRITGLSPFDFSHGFSRTPTLNLADTEPRPISGQSASSSSSSSSSFFIESHRLTQVITITAYNTDKYTSNHK